MDAAEHSRFTEDLGRVGEGIERRVWGDLGENGEGMETFGDGVWVWGLWPLPGGTGILVRRAVAPLPLCHCQVDPTYHGPHVPVTQRH
jgi:hypothetical protein